MKRFSIAICLGVMLCAAPFAQASDPTKKPAAVRIVDGPRVEGTGDTWAVIAWSTNVGGSSVVRYGTYRNRLDQTAMSPYARSGNVHRVRVKNLKPNTSYFFVVDSGQGSGTGTEVKSEVAQFNTKASGAVAASSTASPPPPATHASTTTSDAASNAATLPQSDRDKRDDIATAQYRDDNGKHKGKLKHKKHKHKAGERDDDHDRDHDQDEKH